MDVSPMSMQMMVPRSAEVAQTQSNMNQAINMQQDFQAIEQKADDKLKQSQVRGKENPEDGRIKDDPDRQKKQGGYAGGGRRKKAQQEQAEAETETTRFASDPSRGHFLDISG